MSFLVLFLFLFFAIILWQLFKKNTIDAEGQYHVRIVAHSKGWLKQHLPVVTFYLAYPRFIHSEMMTHKDFSRSAASSRAIPVAKMLAQVWNNPAMPLHWGINQPGMKAERYFVGWKRNFLRNLWQLCGRMVCVFVWVVMKMGLHKQTANRMLEPWQLMHVTLTTCKLANFFNLRIHKDAQPEICFLATVMKRAVDASTPVHLIQGEWHLPWITDEDYRLASHYLDQASLPCTTTELLKKMSAARCARSSYANFDGERTVEGDLNTYAKLVESEPVHASPCEHQCTPDSLGYDPIPDAASFDKTGRFVFVRQWRQWPLHGNLTGYIQYRNTIPNHYKPD